jgi:RimJ/RimL family protein N-acetyltransferase
MPADPQIVFTTCRLQVRVAGLQDAAFFYRLWNDPQVMYYVGFPHGLGLSLAQVTCQLERGAGHSVFERNLLVVQAGSHTALGECYLGLPQGKQVAETDIKLLPDFWGQGYGTEIKQGMLDYLFTHSDCLVVQATPNRENLASIRMQEAVGGVRLGEGVSEIPEGQQADARPVMYYIYQVSRQTWELRQRGR